MDHNESVRKFERLMTKEAEQAHVAATELEALVALLPEKPDSSPSCRYALVTGKHENFASWP